MEDIKKLKEDAEKLKVFGLELGLKAKEVVESLKAFTEKTQLVCKSIEKMKPYKQAVQIDKQIELKVLDAHLNPSFRFKSTKMIAEHLKDKDDEFKDLSNIQIGILLSRSGFRSGTKEGKRGYYVTYKEL